MSAHPSGREGHFNPASPRSSSGAADSFKGTPDTRLTAFSPEDGSAKSSKVQHSLNARGQENRTLRFASNPRGGLELPSSFVRMGIHSEKDPFVSSSNIGVNKTQKLSPTASVFLPYPSTHSNGLVNEAAVQRGDDSGGDRGVDQRSVADPQESKVAHTMLSTDTDMSRCLVIACPSYRLRAHDVGSYLSVGRLSIYVFTCG